MPRSSVNRPISAAEAEVLTWMLRHASVRGPLAHLEPTVPALRVVRHCECGCPTVDFAAPSDADPMLLCDGLGASEDGVRMGVLVFGTDNAITCLEVYQLDRPVRSLPTVTSLEPC